MALRTSWALLHVCLCAAAVLSVGAEQVLPTSYRFLDQVFYRALFAEPDATCDEISLDKVCYYNRAIKPKLMDCDLGEGTYNDSAYLLRPRPVDPDDHRNLKFTSTDYVFTFFFNRPLILSTFALHYYCSRENVSARVELRYLDTNGPLADGTYIVVCNSTLQREVLFHQIIPRREYEFVSIKIVLETLEIQIFLSEVQFFNGTDDDYCEGYTCCRNGTICRVSSTEGYECVCPDGLYGSSCQFIALCASQPCQNGGTCNDHQGDYSCTCPNGYSGKNCEMEFVTATNDGEMSRPTNSVSQSTSSVIRPSSSVSQPTSSVIRPSRSVIRPSSSVGQPTNSMGQPTSSVNQLTSSVSPLTSSVSQPTSSVSPPTSSMSQPTSSVSQPTSSVSQPTSSVGQPTSSVSPPTSSVSQPTSSMSQPTSSVGQPTSSVGQPTSSVSPPTSSVGQPTSSVSQPTSSVSQPTSSVSQLTSSGSPPTSSVSQLTSSGSPPTSISSISQPTSRPTDQNSSSSSSSSSSPTAAAAGAVVSVFVVILIISGFVAVVVYCRRKKGKKSRKVIEHIGDDESNFYALVAKPMKKRIVPPGVPPRNFDPVEEGLDKMETPPPVHSDPSPLQASIDPKEQSTPLRTLTDPNAYDTVDFNTHTPEDPHCSVPDTNGHGPPPASGGDCGNVYEETSAAGPKVDLGSALVGNDNFATDTDIYAIVNYDCEL